MRVRCYRKTEYDGTDAAETRFSTVTIGSEYLVIAMAASPASHRQGAMLQIIGDDGSPRWLPASMFSVTSSRVSGRWRAHIFPNGMIDLMPAAWQERGFWDALYGSDEGYSVEQVRSTHKTFTAEVSLMEAEDPAEGHEQP